MKRIALAIVAAAIISACGGRENIRPNSPILLDDHSAILFLGLTPRTRIQLVRGPAESGVWERPIMDMAEVNTLPEDGYILVRVKPTLPNERLGVSLIFSGRKIYGHCGNSPGPTFTVKPGVINYLGDLSYAFENDQLSYTYRMNEESAKDFLKSRYPGYVDRFEARPMEPMLVKHGMCRPGDTPFIMPIPVRR